MGNRILKMMSILLIGGGALILVLNMVLGQVLNISLPLVFLMISAAFFILAFALARSYAWAIFLYIPGALMAAFGMVFLINVITNDWQSWAYAWLLLVAGLGLGVVLAAREREWRHEVMIAGVGLLGGGITFFALFGAIAGGVFIQVMAPILLVLGGLALYWLKPELTLPAWISRRGQIAAGDAARGEASPVLAAETTVAEANGMLQTEAGALPSTPIEPLVEPLSPRELEVLRLIDQGLSNPEIAEKLVLAPSTVKSHINNIYSKLGVQSRVQALRRARELGLLK